MEELELGIEGAGARKARLDLEQGYQAEAGTSALPFPANGGNTFVGDCQQGFGGIAGGERVHRGIELESGVLRLEAHSPIARQVDAELSSVDQRGHHAHHLDETLDVVELDSLGSGQLAPAGIGDQDDEIVSAVAVHVGRDDGRGHARQVEALLVEAGGSVLGRQGRCRWQDESDDEGGCDVASRRHVVCVVCYPADAHLRAAEPDWHHRLFRRGTASFC